MGAAEASGTAAGNPPRPVDGHGGRSRWSLAVAAITVLGAVPRVLAMRESLAWDELYLYAWVHDRGFGEMLDAVTSREKTPPLGFMLAWLADVPGWAPQAIRIPELIAGVAIIPMTGLLARKAFGQAAGLIAAALAAASPFLVFYSVEARSYALTTALCLAAMLALLRAADTRRSRWWVAWSLLAAGALMSHYTSASVIAVQFAWAFIALRDSRRRVVASLAGPALATAAWLPWLIEQVRNSSDELARINAVAPLGLETVGRIVGRSLGGHPLVDVDRVPGTLAGWMIAGGMVFAFSLALARAVGRARRGEGAIGRPQATTWLIAASALAAPAAAIIVSTQPHQSMLFARNLAVSVPAALAVAAALLAKSSRPIAAAATLLVVGGLAIGTVATVTDSKRPAARDAALAAAERWRPGDRIIELCCLTGAEGPLGEAVALNLPSAEHSSFSVLSRSGDRPYLESLADGGRVFVIGYIPEGTSTELFLNPPKGWSERFRPTWRKTWPGILETVATEYEPAARVPYRAAK